MTKSKSGDLLGKTVVSKSGKKFLTNKKIFLRELPIKKFFLRELPIKIFFYKGTSNKKPKKSKS